MLTLADLAHTVTTVSVTTTRTTVGDETHSESSAASPGILFAPEGVREATDAETARVVGDASLYGDLPHLSADDVIRHADSCCDGSDFALGEWQVVGGSRGWGGGLKVVPIRKSGDA